MVWNPFKRVSKLKARIIDETGNETEHKIGYKDNSFKVGGMTYIIDLKSVVRKTDSRFPIAYYSRNNPIPKDMRHDRNEEVSGVSLTEIIESKVMTDLFAQDGDNKLKLILIASIISAVLSLLVLLQVTGLLNLAS